MSEVLTPYADTRELEARVARILEEARRQGADAAEVSASEDAGLSVTVRLGEVETVEFNRDRGFGITVYFGTRKGSASTSETSDAAIEQTVSAACAIARLTQGDPCHGLAEPELMAGDLPDLDLYHPWPVTVDEAKRLALECEHAARSADARIVNSEGATMSTHQARRVYGNTHGFIGGYRGTRHSVSCAVIAADEHGMQRDHWYTVARDLEGLEPGEAVGREAARRTVARLGSRRCPTGRHPVLFDPHTAAGLVGHLLGALSGGALYRKASFLIDSLGRALLPASLSVVERPHLKRALASAAFDGDGVATYEKAIIDHGRIATYLLGSYSARRLKMRSTGNAGGAHNVELQGDAVARDALLSQMGAGLLVTELMGQGVNLVTGDYSRGAAGFWVEGGEIAHAVDEVTIAATLERMYGGIVAIGDDVDLRGGIRTGSVLIDSMTVAAS